LNCPWIGFLAIAGVEAQNPETGSQVSAQPLAKKTAGLIEKETLKNRITNDELRRMERCALSF